MKQYLLIDIGGTFIKYSLADEQARKISGGKVPTPLTNMDDLLAAIEGFAAPLQGQFVGCAISMPGRIDTRNGIAHTGGMLSAFMWEQPFAAQVEARLGVPVTIANDGKCAAAAEGWTGALAGVENGLVLVLGTGIGGGIVAENINMRLSELVAPRIFSISSTKPMSSISSASSRTTYLTVLILRVCLLMWSITRPGVPIIT